MAVINGTSASELLTGTLNGDIINGYEGDDVIFGGFGNDSMYGDEGDDTFLLNSSAGTDYFNGGSGDDTIVVSDVSSSSIYVDVGIGTLTSIEAIVNNDTKPVYLVTNGSLDLTGITLIDINGFKGSSGNDYMTGEAVYKSSTATWSGITMWGYGGNGELIGSALGDTIDGGDNDDVLYGLEGNDTLLGGNGFDVLFGSTGNDTLTGGTGQDWFWFESCDGVDTVTDFTVGTDKIMVGTTLTSVDLYYYNGNTSTMIEFDGGSTYTILANVDPTTISSNEFLFA